jgi:hypothetical protein
MRPAPTGDRKKKRIIIRKVCTDKNPEDMKMKNTSNY